LYFGNDESTVFCQAKPLPGLEALTEMAGKKKFGARKRISADGFRFNETRDRCHKTFYGRNFFMCLTLG
jgi:hypothetical protein